MEALTFKEFQRLALRHCEEGGRGYAACWDDRTFAYYVKEYGPITEAGALAMFAAAHEAEQQRGGGADEKEG